MGDTYDVKKLKDLINDYFSDNHLKRENAEVELKNSIINGEDLIYAFKDIQLYKEYKELHKRLDEEDEGYGELYKRLDEKTEKINELEEMIKNKHGFFVEKIKEFIDNYRAIDA